MARVVSFVCFVLFCCCPACSNPIVCFPFSLIAKESAILTELARVDHLKSKFVHAECAFTWSGTFCIVFELMDGALTDFLPTFVTRADGEEGGEGAAMMHIDDVVERGSAISSFAKTFSLPVQMKKEQIGGNLTTTGNVNVVEEEVNVREQQQSPTHERHASSTTTRKLPKMAIDVEVLRSVTRQLLFALDLCEQVRMLVVLCLAWFSLFVCLIDCFFPLTINQ
jgi:hypothetical protein